MTTAQLASRLLAKKDNNVSSSGDERLARIEEKLDALAELLIEMSGANDPAATDEAT